jgi:hypothetical protein
MNELEEHIREWIQKTSKIRPELGNFSLCPYSSKAKYLIVKTSADDIGPIYGYDIVFFVVEDYFDLQSVEFWTRYYNQRYPEWIFFEDCPQNETFIQGIPTSNGKYNIITMQNRENLYQARNILAKTGYYHHWSDELIELILGDDKK